MTRRHPRSDAAFAKLRFATFSLESNSIYNFGYTWATRDLTHESMCGILHINDVDHKPTWATHGLHMNLHILHV